MAEVNTGGGEEKKGKPKKISLRVDFTPMVDMNMLLITFFMFCTTLSKPQTMDIVLPTKNIEGLKEEDQSLAPESKSITLILGEENKVYYYFGKPKFDDYTSLKETDYSPNGLRTMLAERNEKIVKEMTQLRIDRAKKKISEEVFKEKSEEIKKDESAQIVIIKPTDAATYKNLVDALDEMAICSVSRYAVVDMADADNYLVENLKTKGALSAQAPAPKN